MRVRRDDTVGIAAEIHIAGLKLLEGASNFGTSRHILVSASAAVLILDFDGAEQSVAFVFRAGRKIQCSTSAFRSGSKAPQSVYLNHDALRIC